MQAETSGWEKAFSSRFFGQVNSTPATDHKHTTCFLINIYSLISLWLHFLSHLVLFTKKINHKHSNDSKIVSPSILVFGHLTDALHFVTVCNKTLAVELTFTNKVANKFDKTTISKTDCWATHIAYCCSFLITFIDNMILELTVC